jgi:hypothetical protein
VSGENFFEFLGGDLAFILVVEETVAFLNIERLVAEEDLLGNLDLPLVLQDELDKSQEHEVLNLALFLLLVPALLFFCLTLLSFFPLFLNACLLLFDLTFNFGSLISSSFLLFLLLRLLGLLLLSGQFCLALLLC